VVLAGRQLARLQASAAQIRSDARDAAGEPLAADALRLTEIELDLTSLASVERFADEFNRLGVPLNVLVCNAGIMATHYGLTRDGFEQQVGTNHVGHHYLTQLLLPRLREGTPARVVLVSSMGHKLANMQAEQLERVFRPSEQQYGAWAAYGNSKLANVLEARELNARHAAEAITAYSLHPGQSGALDGGQVWRWQMAGDGRWQMGDVRWEMGDGG
jgi:NAD(P)-dependent dehydrogenase (short-subunit alcohol dehydrogenase family)